MVEDAVRVIVVGSVNADYIVRVPRLPSRGETVTGGVLYKREGGKGANQAVAAARFGAQVWFIGAVGDDAAGRAAVSALAREGIETAGVAVLPETETGFAAVFVDEHGDNQIAVAPGANHALSVEHVRQAIADIPLDEAAVMLLSFEIPDPPIIAAAQLAHQRRARVLINPAPWRSLSDELVAVSPILTPNAREALALDRRFGHPLEEVPNGDARDAARHLSALTGAPVVVTLGAQGALAVVDGEAVHQGTIAVPSKDTTGAGDAFSGVLAASLAAADPLLQAVRLATAAASLSVVETGARAALPARHQAEVALESMPDGSS